MLKVFNLKIYVQQLLQSTISFVPLVLLISSISALVLLIIIIFHLLLRSTQTYIYIYIFPLYFSSLSFIFFLFMYRLNNCGRYYAQRLEQRIDASSTCQVFCFQWERWLTTQRAHP